MATPVPAGGINLEPHEQEFIGPLFEVLLGIISYICWNYWEKILDFGVFETVCLAFVLAALVYCVLYIPEIIPRALSNKTYAVIAVFVGFLLFTQLSRLYWIYVVPTNASEQLEQREQTKTLEESIGTEPFTDQGMDQGRVWSQEQFEEGSLRVEESLQRDTDVRSSSPSSNKAIPAHSTFNGDCTKYSKRLLSQAVLKSPDKHHIKGQVEMFKRTILLTGKPSHLVLSDKYYGDYEGNAEDIMNRRHNRDATSSVSAKDAVEKALIEMCKILNGEGFAS